MIWDCWLKPKQTVISSDFIAVYRGFVSIPVVIDLPCRYLIYPCRVSCRVCLFALSLSCRGIPDGLRAEFTSEMIRNTRVF